MNAIGHPSKLPMSETTLSRLSMVQTATIARKKISTEEMTFRLCNHSVELPHERLIPCFIDRQAISNDGKF